MIPKRIPKNKKMIPKNWNLLLVAMLPYHLFSEMEKRFQWEN
jgi:hypothetical protein